MREIPVTPEVAQVCRTNTASNQPHRRLRPVVVPNSCPLSPKRLPSLSSSSAELDDNDGNRLGERGHEFGTTTGRKRRCGWFDAVLVRQTCATSGVTGISLTKLDVLDGFKKLKICIGYELDGENLDYLPTAADQHADPRQ